jgi:hypothetical protein
MSPTTIRTVCSALVAVAAVVCGWTPVVAQSVSGRVRDARVGAAVSRVEVSLLDSVGRSVAQARSSDSGEYRVRAPGAGRYRLTARRIGFKSGLSPWLTFDAGDETLSFDFALEPAPQTLAGVTTEAEQDKAQVRTRFGLDPKNINAFVVSPSEVREWSATAHNVTDIIRRIGIPGGLTVREEDSGEPCIQLVGRDRHCMLIVVDDVITDHVRDLDMNAIEDIIVMRPNEAGIWFGALTSNGGTNDPNQRSTAGGVLIIRTKLGSKKEER